MRILHIVGDSKFGGEAVVIRHLVDMAAWQGWQAAVLATDDQARQYYCDHGIAVIPLDAIRRPINPIRDAIAVWEIFRFLKSHPYDVVHTHTSKGGIIGRVAAKLARVPLIVHTVHGFAFHEESSKTALVAYSSAERFAAKFCDQIVTVSHYHRQLALKLNIANPDKITAIPNGLSGQGIRITESPEAIRMRWGLSAGEVTILSTSRLAPQKGLEYLIRAIPQMVKCCDRPFRVLLAGTGELQVPLESLSRSLGVQDRVLFLGFQRDIGSLLGAADIVALPSLWEGLSISLLEAMAARKAIVTTSIGSNLEVLSDSESALIVPPKNVQALAKSISDLVAKPALREHLAANAEARVRRGFSVENMVEQYRQLYLRLDSHKF